MKAIAILALAAIVAAALFSVAPRCQPGDPGVMAGGMLLAGCP